MEATRDKQPECDSTAPALTVDGAIATIRFCKPAQANRLSPDDLATLRDHIEAVNREDSILVLRFMGDGKYFCSGYDISSLAADDAPSSLFFGETIDIIEMARPVTIAALHGGAYGGGTDLALACDFRIAAESARLGSATLRFGLLPDEGGQFLLVQLMGVAKTMDFLVRKRIVSAMEAHELGLVHEVVPDFALQERAMALATELANGPQVAMRLLKRTVYNAAEMTFAHALDDIAAKTAVSDHHPDAREGVRAFQEKREPQFNAWLEEKS